MNKVIILFLIAINLWAEQVDLSNWTASKLLTDVSIKSFDCLYELNDRAKKGKDVDIIISYMTDLTQIDRVRFRALQSLEGTGNEVMLVFAMNLACFGNDVEKVQGYYSVLDNGNKDWVIKTELIMKFIEKDLKSTNGNLAHAAKWYYNKREKWIGEHKIEVP